MNSREAVALIDVAVGARGEAAGVWADLGAGRGTFTRALAELLGPDSTIYAVDRDANAVASLEKLSASNAARVIPVEADFTGELILPGLNGVLLDGVLLANALHFIRDHEGVLARLVGRVRPGGRVVFVEYDRRSASRWVPHPISMSRLATLAPAAGLSSPEVTATRPSAYSGLLYAAVARKIPE